MLIVAGTGFILAIAVHYYFIGNTQFAALNCKAPTPDLVFGLVNIIKGLVLRVIPTLCFIIIVAGIYMLYLLKKVTRIL